MESWKDSINRLVEDWSNGLVWDRKAAMTAALTWPRECGVQDCQEFLREVARTAEATMKQREEQAPQMPHNTTHTDNTTTQPQPQNGEHDTNAQTTENGTPKEFAQSVAALCHLLAHVLPFLSIQQHDNDDQRQRNTQTPIAKGDSKTTNDVVLTWTPHEEGSTMSSEPPTEVIDTFERLFFQLASHPEGPLPVVNDILRPFFDVATDLMRNIYMELDCDHLPKDFPCVEFDTPAMDEDELPEPLAEKKAKRKRSREHDRKSKANGTQTKRQKQSNESSQERRERKILAQEMLKVTIEGRMTRDDSRDFASLITPRAVPRNSIGSITPIDASHEQKLKAMSGRNYNSLSPTTSDIRGHSDHTFGTRPAPIAVPTYGSPAADVSSPNPPARVSAFGRLGARKPSATSSTSVTSPTTAMASLSPTMPRLHSSLGSSFGMDIILSPRDDADFTRTFSTMATLGSSPMRSQRSPTADVEVPESPPRW